MTDSREAFEAWYAMVWPCDVSAIPRWRDGASYKATSVGALLFVSWEAWQHQQARIDALEKERDALKQEVIDLGYEMQEALTRYD